MPDQYTLNVPTPTAAAPRHRRPSAYAIFTVGCQAVFVTGMIMNHEYRQALGWCIGVMFGLWSGLAAGRRHYRPGDR